MNPVEIYEKMGVFYLGKKYDVSSGEVQPEYLLYDSRDLMTHAICVGMTGSGKTGLCIGVLEEAAMDDIPAIIVDPKGDISNLALLFPDLKGSDFEPWIIPEAAKQKGMSVAEYAEREAENWRDGLAQWDQSGERIRRLKDKMNLTVFTPGSTAGVPLSIRHLFTAPTLDPDDRESFNTYVESAAAGLLGLIGEKGGSGSREQTLLANILIHMWQQNHQDVDLGTLIQSIQNPPFNQIGVMDLDSFFPQNDRQNLALKFNALFASPSFSEWLNGEAMDIHNLLYTKEGKPRVSIISIAHLSENERMFFTAMLLNQLLLWTRSQSGTTSLRALFYMDEIFGFFPPVAEPPTKKPLLTLLKQARAYGLGIMLTTQNPMDLDYKGLANIGTWMIGRLQTDRDKQRLLDGLEGAALTAGQSFERGEYDKLISGLQKRVFLMNNVHESEPQLFQTRWAMSYLRGPLTRKEIQALPEEYRTFSGGPRQVSRPVDNAASAPVTAPPAPAEVSDTPQAEPATQRTAAPRTATVSTAVPDGVSVMKRYGGDGGNNVYLLAEEEIFFENKKKGIRQVDRNFHAYPIDGSRVDWESGFDINERDLVRAEQGDIPADIPEAAKDKKSYTQWEKDLKDHLYHTTVLTLDAHPKFKLVRGPEESEADFNIRVQQAARENRDKEVDKLKKSYQTKIDRAAEKIRKAEQAVEREEAQAKDAKLQTTISIGATILSSIFGTKKFGSGTIGKATTAARSAGRAGKQKGDVTRSIETLETYQQQLADLENELSEDLDKLEDQYQEDLEAIDHTEVRPLKRDVQIKNLGLLID